MGIRMAWVHNEQRSSPGDQAGSSVAVVDRDWIDRAWALTRLMTTLLFGVTMVNNISVVVAVGFRCTCCVLYASASRNS
jgi:hypothetical protein